MKMSLHHGNQLGYNTLFMMVLLGLLILLGVFVVGPIVGLLQ